MKKRKRGKKEQKRPDEAVKPSPEKELTEEQLREIAGGGSAYGRGWDAKTIDKP